MILDAFKLDSRVAVVTGTSRGIGQAVAVALAQAGADVVGVARTDQDETRRLVEDLGRQFVPVKADLANRNDHELIIAETLAEFGRIDILVNNAGITHRSKAVDFPIDRWDAILEVNLTAVFHLSQLAARHMIKTDSPGKIIIIASMASFQGGLYIPAYVASKAGVAGLTRSLSVEWARHHINVNAIAPGYFRTDMTAPLQMDPERAPDIASRIPAGRWGEPADLAGSVVFLASKASDYCHGTTLVVDGGWMAR